jgi:hypothetical protein
MTPEKHLRQRRVSTSVAALDRSGFGKGSRFHIERLESDCRRAELAELMNGRASRDEMPQT